MRGARGEYAAIGVAALAAILAGILLRSVALLVVGAAAVLASAAALLLNIRRGREWHQQDTLLRDLWTAVKRIPPGRVLADPDTGDLLSAERSGGWLTLAVTDPPLPGQRQVVARYVIGHWGAPVRPPLNRHLAASDGTPPDPQRLRHPASPAESGALEVTAAELAALVEQVLRTAVLRG